MSLLQRMETRLGLTRADVTLALFLSFTAIAGFVYSAFLEPESHRRGRTELAGLIAYSDSIERAERLRIEARLAQQPDSTDDLLDLDDHDLLRDQEGPRGRELKIEEVAPIDINLASPAILDVLPGVGEKTAARIVANRPFESPEAITRVRGIGPKTLAKMRPWITTTMAASGNDSSRLTGNRSSEVSADTGNRSDARPDSASQALEPKDDVPSDRSPDSLDGPTEDSI